MALTTHKPGAEQGQTLSLCVYGRGGVGKTTLLGTMPGKGLVVDVPQIEGGDFVLEDQSDHIDVTQVREWDEIDAVYWHLKKGEHDYAWVGIDSITAMQILARRKTIADRPLTADPHTLSLPEYGKIGTLLGELVYNFRTLPIHVIWLAQERTHTREEESGTVSLIGPDVLPSALSQLMPSMVLVGRLFVYEDQEDRWQRALAVGPSSELYSKVRAKPGKDVPPIIARPHLGRLLRYMLGNGKRPEEARPHEITFEE